MTAPMMIFESGPQGLVCFVGMLGLLSMVVWVGALVDIVRSAFRTENEKIVWVLVVALTGIIGAVIYFVIGRNQRINVG